MADPVLGLRGPLIAVVALLRAHTTHEDGWCTACGAGEEADGPRHEDTCEVGIVLASAEAALAAHEAERNPASRLDALIASLPPAPDVEEIDAECLDPRMFDWEELRDG